MHKRGDNKFILISIIAIVGMMFCSIVSNSTEKSYTILLHHQDTLIKIKDSLHLLQDSVLSDTLVNSPSKRELRYQTRMKEKSTKDSLKFIKDSLRWAKPRYLVTFALDDSLTVKRIIKWDHNPYINSITIQGIDTNYNSNFYDYPFYKKDVGVTYLGISGSAALLHNYFLRDVIYEFKDFSPYLVYGYTPKNAPMYNTKTPHTELAYWGTFFSNKDKDETNVKFLHTQNINPNFNFAINYERYGASGLLEREATDNRNLTITTNFLGERYIMNSGYIYQGIKREENGGVRNDSDILDTTMDVKSVPYTLSKAYNKLRRNTLFLTQSYGIPIRFGVKDTTQNDSLKTGDGTVTYFGHSIEYSTYHRVYTDDISSTNTLESAFYHDKFYISPSGSYDSTRVSSFDNKVFIRLQPWAPDAIISKLDGGIGYQIISVYGFKPDSYIKPVNNNHYSNSYTYAGASGQFRKYFKWDGMAKFYLSGYNAGDLNIDAGVKFSMYPIDKGIHLTGRVMLSSTSPDWYQEQYCSNHYYWQNNFDKTTESRIEGNLHIPLWNLNAFAGYAIIDNLIYYGLDGVIGQCNNPVTVFSASLQKNLKLWNFHLDNRILYQYTSNKEVLPLPAFSANLRYYMEFDLVKSVMRVQIGADVTYNTEFYAPAYSPALGQFHMQNDRKTGGYPYVDIFANIQWKRASIFVKYINASHGWPDEDYFSASHYIRPQSALKIGVHWPFYVK